MILFFVGNSDSFSQKKYSPAQVLQKVEQQNPALASYQNRIAAVEAIAEGATAQEAPMIGAGFDDTPYLPMDNDQFFRRREGAFTVSAEQTIINPAKLAAKKEYLKSLSVLQQNDYSYLKNQLFAQAKEAYIDRYLAEQRLRVIDQSINLLKLIIEVSELRIAYNQSDLQSIFRAKAKLGVLEAEQAHEQNMVRETTVTLNYLMNEDISQEFDIDTILPLKNYNNQLFASTAADIEVNRSDIQRMNNEIASMRLNQEVARRQSLPDFTLQFTHFQMFGSTNSFMLEGGITIPFAPWSSKGYKAETRSMQFEIDAMTKQKQNEINMVNQMINMTLLKLQGEYVEIDKYEYSVLPNYRKNFDVNLLAYRQNTGDLLRTFIAWDDLQMARMEYLYHLEQTFKLEVEYEKQMEQY